MKKFLVLLLMFLGLFVLAGCKKDTYTIALITDKGDIDDQSFNQGAWEGVKRYVADANKDLPKAEKITYEYYRPTEATDEAYIAAIDLAVASGAKIIITPGYLFESPVNVSQTKYPEVKFVILDGNPENVVDADKNPIGTLEDNTYSIFYAEEQAGYLAGYAAVKDGYRKLGFMGGMAVPAVVKFGHGFVIGADTAAAELNVQIEIKYHYTGDFKATPDVQATAATMYSGGTEVIFACGGAVGQSVMAAAGTTYKVIGVDVDQSGQSNSVITSATKELGNSVYQALEKFFNDEWDTIGGESVILDASEDGVGLPMDTSKFENFTQADYDIVYGKLADGTITIDHKAETIDITQVTVTKTTVIEIE